LKWETYPFDLKEVPRGRKHMFAREGTKAEGAAVQDYLGRQAGRQASARGGGGEDRVWGRSAGEEEAASGKGEGDEMAARPRPRPRPVGRMGSAALHFLFLPASSGTETSDFPVIF